MKILLTGTTGYIGKRLLPVLVQKGHFVVCCVRDKQKFTPKQSLLSHIEIIENDLTDGQSLENIPSDIDIAYYLVHSMSTSRNYDELEQNSAINFRNALSKTSVKQVIYLGGILNSSTLSKHLQSRKTVELELAKGSYALTALRAGIIIGSGSASFEIIRDLVEKLPVMVAPKWLTTRCQPIAIKDVVAFLTRIIDREETFDKSFDIAGADTLTYKEMLLMFSEIRGFKRRIVTVPVMTPRLSSYWLYFVTSTSYMLASSLVDSMKIEVISRPSPLNHIVGIQPMGYKEAVNLAFQAIEQNEVVSSWKDSTISGILNYKISDHVNVPEYGCYKDIRRMKYDNKTTSIYKIWSLGGKNGWYYGTFLWRLRGFADKLIGGVGLRRGRTHPHNIHAGDTLDFWRVLYANRNQGRLLLFAEMRLPGEAWLEFKVEQDEVVQIATFRPKGLLGRAYWFAVKPFHGIIFNGMVRALAKGQNQ